MSLVGELVGSGERQKTPGGVSSSLGGYTRRTFDIVIATAGIGLFAPIFILTAIAIKLDSPGPIFIRKSLFGYGGRVVGAYKFRFVTHRAGISEFDPRWSPHKSHRHRGTSSALQRATRRNVDRRTSAVRRQCGRFPASKLDERHQTRNFRLGRSHPVPNNGTAHQR